MGSKVSDQFAPNTPVQVTGHMMTDSDGRPVLEADELVNRKARKATLDLTAARVTPPAPVPVFDGWLGNRWYAPGSCLDWNPQRSHHRPGLSRTSSRPPVASRAGRLSA